MRTDSDLGSEKTAKVEAADACFFGQLLQSELLREVARHEVEGSTWPLIRQLPLVGPGCVSIVPAMCSCQEMSREMPRRSFRVNIGQAHLDGTYKRVDRDRYLGIPEG